jgi:hypothetical protein
MQVDAEDARHQDAVPHLELPQLHVAHKLVDDDLAVDAGRLWGIPGLRHPRHLLQNVTIDAATGPAGFAGLRAAALPID